MLTYILQVHRLLLVSACPYLLSIGGQHDAPMLELKLPMTLGLEGLNIFLTYLYEGVLNLTASNMDSVERIAEMLHVECILDFCEEFRLILGRGKVPHMKGQTDDYTLNMTETSLQIFFSNSSESDSPSKKRLLGPASAKKRRKTTPAKSVKSEKTESPKRTPTRKAAKRASEVTSQIMQHEDVEEDITSRVKQEPSSDNEYNDDYNDDTESNSSRTDFVKQAPYQTSSNISQLDTSDTGAGHDPSDIDSARVVKNIMSSSTSQGIGVTTAEMGEDNQPR